MSDRISLSTWMANIQIRLLVWRAARHVGTDALGNRYFEEKKARKGMKARRWVLYRGEPDASLVPPEWHGWMHYNMASPLPEGSEFHKSWQKPHLPNPTGTVQAYRPPGHLFSGGKRDKATGDYQAWTPN